MKANLTSDFEAAVAAYARHSQPKLVIIGYADAQGVYLRNIDLGLQRASAVAAYLERSFPGSAKVLSVSSGGIKQGPDARRVEVLVS